ncbi:MULTISPECIES: NADPH-dependent FMN reductase [unclassified Caballeronia]|jgi:FMN reductase|uniref:NADPH-dependent FMN reductase n=1 Tax=unclassified Caballeronia TaxID=2646786 RepID=UPI0020289F2D|nr:MULTISPECIES: NAD(P)H-dependent oxidoreductase [unclassified Caballeronia]
MARPFILGIGGTLRDGSTSERALRISVDEARSRDCEVEVVSGDNLVLPMYAPGVTATHHGARRLVELIRRCDGIIVSTPSYHGGLSGLVKNALDYLEDLRDDSRPYLDARPVGCIVCAGGWQGVGLTLTSLRSIVHALRGWPTPLGVGINTIIPPGSEVRDPLTEQEKLLRAVGEQVAGFAWNQRVSCRAESDAETC